MNTIYKWYENYSNLTSQQFGHSFIIIIYYPYSVLHSYKHVYTDCTFRFWNYLVDKSLFSFWKFITSAWFKVYIFKWYTTAILSICAFRMAMDGKISCKFVQWLWLLLVNYYLFIFYVGYMMKERGKSGVRYRVPYVYTQHSMFKYIYQSPHIPFQFFLYICYYFYDVKSIYFE